MSFRSAKCQSIQLITENRVISTDTPCPKNGDTKLMVMMVVTLLFLNKFSVFLLSDSAVNLQQNIYIKDHTAPRMRRYTTLWNVNVRKWATVAKHAAINDKLQGTVVTYLRCVRFSIIKLRKVYCWAFQWIVFNRWIFGIVTGKKENCVVHFLRLLALSWPGARSVRNNNLLACNFAEYSPILFFSLADSTINHFNL